jgi:hypothetical protein
VAFNMARAGARLIPFFSASLLKAGGLYHAIRDATAGGAGRFDRAEFGRSDRPPCAKLRSMTSSQGSQRFFTLGLVAAALAGAPLGCGGGTAQPTTASPSCYPSCVASLLEECPLQGACQGTVGLTSAKVCYSNGIKVNDELITGPETVTVNNASGQPCYVVTQTSTTPRLFSVTVNGQEVARITDNKASQNNATIYCGGSPTVLAYPTKASDDCQPLWWNDEQRCTSGTCTFP